MKPLRGTLPIDEARAIVMDAVRPIERVERVPLSEADGRVLAEPVAAPADVPSFDRAAMDGYAVRADDTVAASHQAPVVLRVVAKAFTGAIPSAAVESGTCVQIATGAPVPRGADAVVMVEETEPAPPGGVRVLAPAHPGRHVSPRAGDIAAGATVVAAGAVLTPSRVGAIAATGAAVVTVHAKPRVAILSTGSEIVRPGAPLAPGHVYDINGVTLGAIVRAHGGIPVPFASVADDPGAIADALERAAASSDLLVVSGGSSVGEKDLVVGLLQGLGEVRFHGIAVKPGKPTAFGFIGRTAVLGMPGNPASCLSNGYLLLLPALRQMARLPAHQPRVVRAPLARRVQSVAGRHQFYTVRLENGSAVPAFKGSGDITSMSQADGFFEIPAHREVVDAGDLVDVTLF
jgi:molybdenum cofactor synthesis domain-containing protein